MRAPFQVLALPYKICDDGILYAVFHRSNEDMWQFLSGGGEDQETPEQAVRREIWEESGIHAEKIERLTSLCYIGTGIYPKNTESIGLRICMYFPNIASLSNVRRTSDFLKSTLILNGSPMKKPTVV